MLQTLTDSYNFTDTLQKSGSDVLAKSDVDDTPVNGETTVPVSSNWAYDHNADTSTAHGLSGKVSGVNVAKLTSSASAPVGPQTGDLWLDTAVTPSVFSDDYAKYLVALNFGAEL